MKKAITSRGSLVTIPGLPSVVIFPALALVSLMLCHTTQAVNPPPDGGYAGGNTAEGQGALLKLTSGTFNTAIGLFSLRSNIEGNLNTAIGAGALFVNTSNNNTATGTGALAANTIGSDNAANGTFALSSNTTGTENAAFGSNALINSTTGGGNTAIGFNALPNNTTGITNTAVGFNAGFGITTADNIIVIGTNVSGQNVDHSCFIGEIFGSTVSNSTPVFINSDGRLGTITSSQRFKEGIEPMAQASETLFALKPVRFHYKKEIDPTKKTQFGLVAEDVEKVNPDLVLRDKDGKAYGVRYDQVNAMLLNEFLKEHREVETQKAIISELQSAVASLRKNLEATNAKQQKEIEALIVGFQTVSSELKIHAVEAKTLGTEQPTAKSRHHKYGSPD